MLIIITDYMQKKTQYKGFRVAQDFDNPSGFANLNFIQMTNIRSHVAWLLIEIK